MIEVTQGSLPIVLSIPHSGTQVPDEIRETFTDTGKELAETDWHIDRLYNGLGMDLSVVRTSVHRYVLDVDQAPEAFQSFPWLSASGIFPLTDRAGAAIYRENAAPDAAQMAARIERYHVPYHEAISSEMARLKAQHGIALLFDCHSIGSFYRQGLLQKYPIFNIWTNLSKSCAPSMERSVLTRCSAAQDYDTVLSTGTSGGWSVRKHGRPARNAHAMRLELAQRSYMDETPPWHWRADKAERLRSVLYRVLNDLVELLNERAQG